MKLDAAKVYFTDGIGRVQAVAKSGGPLETLASGQEGPQGMDIDDQYVYWANHLGTAIRRARKDGSNSPELVATATAPAVVQVFGDDVYWIDDNRQTVWRAPKTGGTAVDVINSSAIKGLWRLPVGIEYYECGPTGSSVYCNAYSVPSNSLFEAWNRANRYVLGNYLIRDSLTQYVSVADVATNSSITIDRGDQATLLTANTCQLFGFLEPNLKMYPLSPGSQNAGRPGSVPIVTLASNIGWDTTSRAVSDEDNLYFFVHPTLYRLPLPK